MKSRSIGLSLAGATLLSFPAFAQTRSAALNVSAENPLAVERRDEIVSVPWSEVIRALTQATASRVSVKDTEGRELTSQVVDNENDGKPDELLFLADFWPTEKKAFVVTAAPATGKFTPRVFIRHDDPRDDMAWESDRIAFRIYGEGLKKTASAMSSNGIDVWEKSVRSLVVEKWYSKGHDNYHVDTGEGADFFDVGETLGAGGTAIWKNDTIYRADNFKAWKILANGPIRAIFELRYDPWSGGGVTVSETKRITIDAGMNLYRAESIFKSDGSAVIPYAIGLVKRPGMRGTESADKKWAWVAGWGPVAPKNGGHGELGTAVLIPRATLKDWKEIGDHYLAIGSARSGAPAVHYIGAGWTASGDFPTPQSWWAYLDSFADRLNAPIKVTVAQNR
jgi:pectinesterase